MDLKGLVFFDLDGTLLDENSQVSPENQEALRQLKANGYEPIINTGRSIIELTEVLEQSQINSVVIMNGSAIIYHGEEIYSQGIPVELCERLLNTAREHGEEIGFYSPHHIWISGRGADLLKHYEYFHGQTPEVNDQAYKDHEINMLLVGTANKDLDSVYAAAVPELNFFRNSPYSIDVTIKGFDKGTGVRKMIELLDAQDLPTYAFGDGGNDGLLLQAVDHGIAMANAYDSTKSVAEFITHKNTEDGIVFGLKHYGLI
jgi:Cof subfamily protein (haloacid dehalogenase superfamily)